ncbi:DUF3168 domain-containing protein [Selenomonas sputigena]|uniref:DUF3168 domain-containing protein n=1 Tax=Selenomonas sputigena TaxID=69823 RepID=UPI0028EFE67A|nr:DUF3168 domain-containing protein [Selenomonas sputigena]
MRVIREVPMVAHHEALVKLLQNGQDCPVHGAVPLKAKRPYITVGDATFKPNGTKDCLIWRISTVIDVWAAREQRKKLNEIMNDVSTLLTGYWNKLHIEGFRVMDCDIDFLETFEEAEGGHHGIVTLVTDLQK